VGQITGSNIRSALLAIRNVAHRPGTLLPAYRPALGPGKACGIDVSSHQHRINWKQVARQHVPFTYIKATEAATWVDPQFAANWSGAAQGGIPHGAYHFYSLCSTGAAQARNFLRVLPPPSSTSAATSPTTTPSPSTPTTRRTGASKQMPPDHVLRLPGLGAWVPRRVIGLSLDSARIPAYMSTVLMRGIAVRAGPELVVPRDRAVLAGGGSPRQRITGQVFSLSRSALGRPAITSSQE
jgi:Glycosyl hydrolases family 25